MIKDYKLLWEHVAGQFHGGPHSVHGPAHWERVKTFGLAVAKSSGAHVEVVQLFALFHDSCRLNDGFDPEHGARGAEYARQLHGTWFELDDEVFAQLHYACTWHTDQIQHEDPTIGTCWDADRLDLGRVGIIPEATYMNTAAGKMAAEKGSTWFLQANEEDAV